jgi:hypothetical protein
MKPLAVRWLPGTRRLPVAPLTDEDFWIWARRYTRRSWQLVNTVEAYAAQENVIGQDRRDAELMQILAWGFEHGARMEGSRGHASHMACVWRWCAFGLNAVPAGVSL